MYNLVLTLGGFVACMEAIKTEGRDGGRGAEEEEKIDKREPRSNGGRV